MREIAFDRPELIDLAVEQLVVLGVDPGQFDVVLSRIGPVDLDLLAARRARDTSSMREADRQCAG